LPAYIIVGEIVEANRKKDAKKRKELSELKAEMEREVKVFLVSVYNLLSYLVETPSFLG